MIEQREEERRPDLLRRLSHEHPLPVRSVACSRSMCLCRFSTMTIAASTRAPMAMAMPPSDMMLA